MMKIAPLYQLPDNLAGDIDAYAGEVERFASGALDADQMKALRVPRGVYEQRRDGAYMVRVRVAGGRLSAAQARELAAIGRDFGNARLHLTSRQDLQFHDVRLEDTPRIMRRLLAAGLSTRGGGGNTVRNVAACPYAGVCPAECFDVTPCVQAVTEYLIARPDSYTLPRKYKIAFSGCAADCALAQVADLGLVAEARGGRPGFRVLAGGGMGARPRIAECLLDWIPAAETIRVAETIRRLFDELGDRENRGRARLRYAVERLGMEAFTRLYAERAREVAAEGVPDCRCASALNAADPAPARLPPLRSQDGLRVLPQRQAGRVSVSLHVPLGFLPASDLAALADLAARFSAESGLRLTRHQNLMIHGVREADLAELAAELRRRETDLITPRALDRFTACVGAAICRTGGGQTLQVATACAAALDAAGLAREVLDELPVHINGCPNACGHQPVAPIGCYGVSMRVNDGPPVPAFAVTLGGRCDASGARFGRLIGRVPATALPALLGDLAVDFASNRSPGETWLAYVDRSDPARFEALAARCAAT